MITYEYTIVIEDENRKPQFVEGTIQASSRPEALVKLASIEGFIAVYRLEQVS